MAGSYIVITEVPASTKTKRWRVNSTSGTELGYIRFYPQWRCFGFFPAVDTLYNAGCLTDIAKFLADQTALWQRERKQNCR